MPTLPSISFNIFRKNFFANCKNLIPKYKLIDFLNIKEAFTGGATDMYIPTNLDLSKLNNNTDKLLTEQQVNSLPVKEKLYFYDYNSLFAAILRNALIPCGDVRSFIGDIWSLEP